MVGLVFSALLSLILVLAAGMLGISWDGYWAFWAMFRGAS